MCRDPVSLHIKSCMTKRVCCKCLIRKVMVYIPALSCMSRVYVVKFKLLRARGKSLFTHADAKGIDAFENASHVLHRKNQV